MGRASQAGTAVPRVSVIIPTYNWGPVLPIAIASVLDQSFTNFELLVIGDACTDESAEVVKGITDPRVHWHNLEVNVGHQSGPNNLGVSLALGEIIAYLGHDDLWCPDHLSNLVRAIDFGASIAHTSVALVDPTGSPRSFPKEGFIYRPGTWIPPTSVAHTRQLIAEVGPWKHPRDTGGLDPESELWARMARLHTPVWVRTLDCVKLSAGKRKNVYRTRPHREQAYWLTRIRSTKVPEAMLAKSLTEQYELAPELAAAEGQPRPVPGMANRWLQFALKTFRKAIGRPTTTALERYTRRRRFKGLD
jgi:glycosyltransferase involved in cell wall biosynthesis